MIELVPKIKDKRRITLTPYRIAVCASAGLALAVVFSLFLVGLQKRSVERRLEEIGIELAEESTEEINQIEREVFITQNKIEVYEKLLGSHRHGSNFFTFISELTHKKTFFKQADIGIREGRVFLTGETESFSDLRKQILLLKNEEQVERVDLANVSLGDYGEIEFTIILLLSPSVFESGFNEGSA